MSQTHLLPLQKGPSLIWIEKHIRASQPIRTQPCSKVQARKRKSRELLFSSEFNEVGLVTQEGIKGEFSVTELWQLKRELKCSGHLCEHDGLSSELHQEEYGWLSSCFTGLWELWEEFSYWQSAAVADNVCPSRRDGRWTPEASAMWTSKENLGLRAWSLPKPGPQSPAGERLRRTTSVTLR